MSPYETGYDDGRRGRECQAPPYPFDSDRADYAAGYRHGQFEAWVEDGGSA